MHRIGFDAKRLFNNFTGLGNYSRTLVRNLVYYYPDFAYFLYTPKVQKNPDTTVFLNSPAYSVHTPGRIERPIWRTYRVRQQLKQHKINLFHGLSNEIPFGLDHLPVKKVVSVHDLIYKHFPRHYPAIDRQIYDLKTKYACQHSDQIVAISASTKADLIQYYKVPEHKISVIYQTCAEDFFQDKSEALIEKVSKKYNLPSNYMLYVGSITERKNLLGILRAMKRLPRDMELPLVIVGGGRRYLKEVQQFLVREGLKKFVHFIQPENEDLPFIYQKANLFIYPSFYEGFGIPIIEALFSRTPVITSNCSSMPEAAGPDSMLIDPHEPEAIAQAIDRVLSNTELRETMTRKGYAYAQRFRPEPVTRELVALYQSLL